MCNFSEAATRMASRARRQVALEKTNELAKLIDNWDNRDIGLCCNEFIRGNYKILNMQIENVDSYSTFC